MTLCTNLPQSPSRLMLIIGTAFAVLLVVPCILTLEVKIATLNPAARGGGLAEVGVVTDTKSMTTASATDERDTLPIDSLSLSSYDSTIAEQFFIDTAKSLHPVTDKVTKHKYERMYGQYLLPFYKSKPKMKFLEIGLGCDMKYGPGASVALWKKLFPSAEIWEADYDDVCAKKEQEKGNLEGIHVLTGDQGDVDVLDKWIDESGGGDFNVVIDDGGHKNCQIWTTFLKLWPLLQPGGLYFLEDLHVGRHPRWSETYESPLCSKGTIVSEELKKKIDGLLYERDSEVKFLTCQLQACVLQKV